MVKILLALILFAHGVGHSLGPLQLLRIATGNPQWDGSSWLLTGPAATTLAHVFGLAAWTGAILGFTALAAVVLGWFPASWWAPLAVGSAVASLAGLLLFPIAFPAFSTVAALLVDLGVLAGALLLRWTPAQLAS